MPLTDTSVRNTKPKVRPYKLADGQGLHLLVNPNGSRLWRLKYRVAGKEKLLSIGAYPTVSIKMAREARDNARELLATGVDPSQARKEAKRADEAATCHTFSAIADEYLAKLKREGRSESTLTKLEWILGFAKRGIGLRPVREISAPKSLKCSARSKNVACTKLPIGFAQPSGPFFVTR